MLYTLWSVKGGSGVTVVAAGLATVLAERSGRAVLVDLAGDLPAAVGAAEPVGPGVLEWLAAADGPPDALARLFVPAGAGVELLPRGKGPCPSGRAADLVAALTGLGCPVVIDAGVVGSGLPTAALAGALAGAGRSLLVVRPCFLALRRARPVAAEADGVVLVAEPARALDARDVEAALGVPVLTTVGVDPGVARAVDAGVLTRRPPRTLERPLRALA